MIENKYFMNQIYLLNKKKKDSVRKYINFKII